MAGKCSNKDCPAPISCHDCREDHTTCPNWTADVAAGAKKTKKETPKANGKVSTLNWSGLALTPPELHLIGARSSPLVISIFGKQAAGKTTFLAMLYTLLLNGRKLTSYQFTGSKTILAWDELYHRLKFKQGDVEFPAPTPAESIKQYHLALRDLDAQLKDLLFCDASGETFTLWAKDRADAQAENPRWMYGNSNAFMLFIDCEALIQQKGLAKREIMNIAQQLTHDIQDRPVIAVWSKSDKKNEVHATIRESLSKDLQAMFANFTEMDISNFLDPGPDELVHKNNLAAVDWLLDKMNHPVKRVIAAKKVSSTDVFLNYTGK